VTAPAAVVDELATGADAVGDAAETGSNPPDLSAQTVRRAPASLAVALAGLMIFSVVTMFFGGYLFAFSGFQEQRSQAQLYAQWRGLLDPSSEVPPSIGGTIAPGTPVAMLNSPAAGLHNVIVVEGTTSGQLLAGPGHLRDTPLPGQAGDSVLIGKSTTAGAPFGGLTALRKGDVITVTTGQGTFRYLVVALLAAGENQPRVPVTGSLLTLVTAGGTGWLSGLAPSHLVYVEATLRGRTVPAPPGRPVEVAPSELRGAGDPAAWVFVIFWLQALLLVSIAVVWMWFRWGRVQSWLVGVPVAFAILWALSTETIRLMPNVY
jgi:sortase A